MQRLTDVYVLMVQEDNKKEIKMDATKAFDDKITALTIQIPQLQTALDSDPFNVQLQAIKKKSDDLGKAQNGVVDTQNKKAQFVSIQSQIDTKTQEISDLEAQKQSLLDSIA